MTSGVVSPYRAWRYRRHLQRIREVFASLGYPLDDLSDEDIERNAVAFGEAWNRDTLTFEQAEACIERLHRADHQIGARLERIGAGEVTP